MYIIISCKYPESADKIYADRKMRTIQSLFNLKYDQRFFIRRTTLGGFPRTSPYCLFGHDKDGVWRVMVLNFNEYLKLNVNEIAKDNDRFIEYCKSHLNVVG